MKNRILWALVALNALLLTTLVVRTGDRNQAIAAPAGAGRSSDYLLIAGDVSGGPSSIVYVLDTTNAVLGGITYAQGGNRGKLEAMPPVDLSRLFEPPAAGGVKNR